MVKGCATSEGWSGSIPPRVFYLEPDSYKFESIYLQYWRASQGCEGAIIQNRKLLWGIYITYNYHRRRFDDMNNFPADYLSTLALLGCAQFCETNQKSSNPDMWHITSFCYYICTYFSTQTTNITGATIMHHLHQKPCIRVILTRWQLSRHWTFEVHSVKRSDQVIHCLSQHLQWWKEK